MKTCHPPNITDRSQGWICPKCEKTYLPWFMWQTGWRLMPLEHFIRGARYEGGCQEIGIPVEV